ncbi:MAG: IS21-like element helper ATPase IstB [Elusimicrobiota bacterium]
MLNEQTVSKMEGMKLFGMSRTYKDMMGSSSKSGDLSHDEFLGLLIDSENTYREDMKLKRLLYNAKLKQNACLEDIDYRHQRSLHKKTILELSSCKWIENHQNVLISGPTGIGKSFIVCALGNCAARHGYSVLYTRAPRLYNSLYQARADGSYSKQLGKLSRFNVLIIDDIGLSPMTETERKDLLEIVEDRNLTSSTIIGSQIPIKDWYQIIGDPTIADAICDRLLHNAYRVELKGESMRKMLKQSDVKTAG